MSVNWFEGGRRISKVFMGLVALGGTVAVYETYDPKPLVASRGPTMPWFVTRNSCDYPSYKRVLPDFDWGGPKPGLTLCFLAFRNGKIPHAIAPTPPEEEARQVRQEAEDKAQIARGEPPPLRLASPYFYADNTFSSLVQAYVDNSSSDFRLTPELKAEIGQTSWRGRAFMRAVDQVLPWAGGLCAGLWILTYLIGWIVRGFAGVPRGEDFKPAAKA